MSYRDFITEAGVSRGAIREAIDEAIAGGFISCNRRGRPNNHGQPAETARYAIRWAANGDRYATGLDAFRGFYAGEGYRSPIPNAFFDLVVPLETLAVVKVVGTVLRHTVGYQNQFGGRRSDVPLSYSYIQKYANLKDRPTLARAIRHAVEVGFVRRVQDGLFDPRSSHRRPAAYAVNWLEQATDDVDGSKSLPANRRRFRNPTSDGSKSLPAERFKNPTKQKKKPNDTCKQQAHAVPAAVVADNKQAFLLLREMGFDEQVAAELSATAPLDQIQNQIDWLEKRNPKTNRLGMLRQAIEQGWSRPVTVEQKERLARFRERDKQRNADESAKRAAEEAKKRERAKRRKALLRKWQKLSHTQQSEYLQLAIDQANSDSVRRHLRRQRDADNPPTAALLVMAAEQGLAVGDY